MMGRGLHQDGHEVQGRYEMLNTITKIKINTIATYQNKHKDKIHMQKHT